MPFAATHILAAIIIVELFREYFVKDNQKFPRYYILIAAIGGILPDFDVGFFYILHFFGFTIEQVHRTFVHSIFIPLIFLAIGILILKTNIKSNWIRKHHMKLSTILFILSVGSTIHIILDATLAGGVALLYPISNTRWGLNLITLFPTTLQGLILPSLDAILIIFWLFWMEFKLKISDYF